MAATTTTRRLLPAADSTTATRRSKTTEAAAVASRHRDPTFEKLMLSYKHYQNLLPVLDLILSSPSLSLPFPHLLPLSQRLRLNRGAHHFVRCHPHVLSLSPSSPHPLVTLTPSALSLSSVESSASSASAAAHRILRLLSMSVSGTVPLRAVFRVWRELGLPDDFEHSVLRGNHGLFSVTDNPKERNTHVLELVGGPCEFTAAVEWRREELSKERIGEVDAAEMSAVEQIRHYMLELVAARHEFGFTTAVEWRKEELSKERIGVLDAVEIRYAFKQGFPPGMRLTQDYRSKLKKWQRLPYIGPYESLAVAAKRSKLGMRQLEKRAVGIVHEFLSLTVEKMVEVEKVSQFRKYFGIDLNIRDLFLDHPGIFYLSTKGKGHMVFLREAYAKGRLLQPNPIYDARTKLHDLVRMRRRGVVAADDGLVEGKKVGVEDTEEEDEDVEEEKEEDEGE